MLFENEHEESTDKDFLLRELSRFIALRNQMGGALYWNVIKDDCIKLCQKCSELGVAWSDIVTIMESGRR